MDAHDKEMNELIEEESIYYARSHMIRTSLKVFCNINEWNMKLQWFDSFRFEMNAIIFNITISVSIWPKLSLNPQVIESFVILSTQYFSKNRGSCWLRSMTLSYYHILFIMIFYILSMNIIIIIIIITYQS
jgi:hypothetical protein